MDGMDNPDINATVLYIGNLDKRVTENMMMDIFKKGLPQVADKVLEAKMVFPTELHMQATEGYCFVHFADNSTANLGMAFINGREFFGKKVKVNWAVNSASGTPKVIGTSVSIYVGDLDEEINDETLKKFFEPCGEVLSVKVVMDPATGQSKGFGFVSFSNKMDATNAIESMNGQQLGKRTIKTNWASRNKAGAQTQNTLNYNDVYQAAAENNCTVYVGSLPGQIPNDLVKQHFIGYGNIVDTRIFVDKGFAFIKFDSHEAAATAITKANGSEMHGSYLKCWWGKDGPETGSMGGMGGGMGGGGHQEQRQANVSSPPQENNQVTQQMKANMQAMCQAQNMTPQQQTEMMNYMMSNPWYYEQCMVHWQNYQKQMQMQMSAQSQNYMNSQQYAAMYGYQQQQQAQQYGQQAQFPGGAAAAAAQQQQAAQQYGQFQQGNGYQ